MQGTVDGRALRGPIGNPTATALFLGEKSRTADRAALARAKEMLKGGASRDDVWRETGWGQDTSGHWFYEVDDRGFATGPALSGRYRDVFRHPELEAAYGDRLDTVHVSADDAFKRMGEGMYVPAEPAHGLRPFMWLPTDRGAANRRSYGLHESQHMVDDFEDALFQAANDRSYRQRREEVRARNVQRRRDFTPEERRARPPWATEDVPAHMIDILNIRRR
jgi:hypothetical protein